MSKAQQITSKMNMGNLTDALKTGLQNVPWDGTPQQKREDAEAVVNVLVSFKDQQINEALNGLSVDEIDVLMKYVFKGLSMGNAKYSSQLFKWFEAIETKTGGLGAITRVLTDTKQSLDYV
jgi:actin related protein 2/3 complex subunit 5